MSKNDITEIKLQGRIYPAIQSCVSNRYKIVLGLFAYYGFLLSANTNVVRIIYDNKISLWFSIILWLLYLHNSTNYLLNRHEKIYLEGSSEKYSFKKILSWPWIEILSFIIITSLIILSFLFIGNNYDC